MTEGSVWCCNDHRRGNKHQAHNPAANQVSRHLVPALTRALYMWPWTKCLGWNFPTLRSSKSLNLWIHFKKASTKIREYKFLDLHSLQNCHIYSPCSYYHLQLCLLYFSYLLVMNSPHQRRWLNRDLHNNSSNKKYPKEKYFQRKENLNKQSH